MLLGFVEINCYAFANIAENQWGFGIYNGKEFIQRANIVETVSYKICLH